MLSELFVVPFAIGLLGAGHCVAMCGGIVAALSFSSQGTTHKQSISIVLSYNLGRILSYTLVGVLVGGVGSIFSMQFQTSFSFPVLGLISSILLLLLGLYMLGVQQVLAPIEKLGSIIWRKIQPIGTRFLPIQNYKQGFIVGAVWGWLPCGLVYTAVAYSLAQQSFLAGGVAMLSFGLGTLPALLLGGFAGDRLKKIVKAPNLRKLCGVALLIYGAWTLMGSIQAHSHDHGQTHKQANEHSHTHHDID